jgi:hypothetical protein
MVPRLFSHAIAASVCMYAASVFASPSVVSAQSVPNFVGAKPAPASELERANEDDARRKAEREFNRLAMEAEAERRAVSKLEGEKAIAREQARQALLEEQRRTEDAKRKLEREAEASRSEPPPAALARPAEPAAPSVETNAQQAPPIAPPPSIPPSRQAMTDAQQQDAARYVARGIALLKQGDIVQARGFFERAADLGAPEAALILAQTFDGRVLKKWRAVGIAENKERAVFWYFKAQMLGSKEAGDALKALSP